MTLSTLKTMNVSMGELRDALSIKMPEAPAVDDADDEPDAAPPAPAAPRKPRARPAAKAAKAGQAADVPPVVDPMQWWGALTKQFTELAAGAMKDTATDAAKNLAGAMVKQSFDAAGETLKKAASVPAAVAKTAAQTAAKTAGTVAGTMAGGAAAARKAASRKPPARRR